MYILTLTFIPKVNKGKLTRYVIPYNLESPVLEKMVDQMK